MAATFEQVAQIYVATFNRAPDAAGINYWMTQSFGGNPTIEQIASSFFDQSEAQAFYQDMNTTSALVAAAYQNLFNRAPDSAGQAYWVAEIDAGRVSQSNMLLALVNGAQDSADGLDRSIMSNKTTVGLAFANAGLNDTALATSIMSGITASADTVTAAQSIITQNAPADTSFQLTEAWLAGKTLYNVYDDGNDGVAETDTMAFYDNGTGFIAGEYGSSNFTYNVDASGVLTMTVTEEMTEIENGTSYIKAIQMDDAVDNAIQIEWTTDYTDAATYTAGEGYEYLAITTDAATALQQSIAANSSANVTGFYFTSEWLSGRTVYDVTGDEDASYTNTDGPRDLTDNIITMTFNNDGTLTESHSVYGLVQETWSVDANHTIVISGPEGIWYMRASGEVLGTGGNAYVVYSEDDYTRFSTNDHYMPEAIATDLATAQSLIGTYLPAENVFAGW